MKIPRSGIRGPEAAVEAGQKKGLPIGNPFGRAIAWAIAEDLSGRRPTKQIPGECQPPRARADGG